MNILSVWELSLIVVLLAMAIKIRFHLEEQKRAHNELRGTLRNWAKECLAQVIDVQESELPSLLAMAASSMRHLFEEYRETASNTLDEYITDDFYKLALKASLPNKIWKEEFNNRLGQIQGDLVDIPSIENELGSIFAHLITSIEIVLLDRVKVLDETQLPLSATARRILVRYRDNPRKLQQLMTRGANGIHPLSLTEETFKAIGLIGIGSVLGIASSGPNITSVSIVAGVALRQVLGNEISNQVRSAITGWFAHEVGKATVSELLQTFTEVASVVGIAFGVFRVLRCIRFYNRIFVHNDSYNVMKTSAKVAVNSAFDTVEFDIEKIYREYSIAYLKEFEDQLSIIVEDAKEDYRITAC